MIERADEFCECCGQEIGLAPVAPPGSAVRAFSRTRLFVRPVKSRARHAELYAMGVQQSVNGPYGSLPMYTLEIECRKDADLRRVLEWTERNLHIGVMFAGTYRTLFTGMLLSMSEGSIEYVNLVFAVDAKNALTFVD